MSPLLTIPEIMNVDFEKEKDFEKLYEEPSEEEIIL
jgi:hypothetical protein